MLCKAARYRKKEYLKASMVLNHDTSCQKNKDIEYCASFVNSKSVFLKVKKSGGKVGLCFLGHCFGFECDDLTNFL
jgi:hypothetical protein